VWTWPAKVGLASKGGPGKRRWTWPAEVDLAAGEADGKECSLLSNSDHGYYQNGQQSTHYRIVVALLSLLMQK